MTRIVLFLLALLLLAGPSCTSEHLRPANTSPAASPTPSPTASPAVEELVVADIPKATWEPIFFEAIDERTKTGGIGRLRDTSLADTDIEVRIWGGFGLSTLEGLILRRTTSQWSAFRLDQDLTSGRWEYRTINLSEPHMGWEHTWIALLQQNLLILPDARSIDCDDTMVEDGYSYVVEIKKGENYRTYMYDNPDGRCKESESMVRIAKIIEEQFDLDRYRPTPSG